MKPTLLVMAAGIGNRYGGLKQIDPVGPGGEIIVDYSVYDALKAGYAKLVFVIRKEIEKEFRTVVGGKFEDKIDVHYIFQQLDAVPDWFSVPADRRKPWGTTHAVLAAQDKIAEPFAAINADDFYGASAFQLAAEHLAQAGSLDSTDYCNVGYILRDTLSDHGTVARAILECDGASYLTHIEELTRIEKVSSGVVHKDADGSTRALTGNEAVSMNFWGFHPSVFSRLRENFDQFLREHGTEARSELYVPTTANDLVATGKVRFKVVRCHDEWFGVTYREDKPAVVESIRGFIDEGRYPERLWD